MENQAGVWREIDYNFQLKLAAEAGEDWFQEYKYHLEVIDKPLPFYLFRTKKEQLDRLLESDPDGEKPWLDNKIYTLCKELGM